MPDEQRRPAAPMPPTQQEAATQEQAAVAKELEEHPRDETAEGGRFMVDGQLVDADGQPVKGKRDE